MATAKTQPTAASIDAYVASRASPEQAADCGALIALMEGLTGETATMWGPSIVGFGRYAYRYDSGRTGEAPLLGFAIRGRELVVYLSCEGEPQSERLARLGPHKMGKSCLYLKRLADLDAEVLEQLLVGSIDELRARHPPGGR